MQPTLLAAYTRVYSDLPPFQSAGQTEYALYEIGGRLHVTAHAVGCTAQRSACELTGQSAAHARHLLQFLYENAVPVQHLCDVVQDLHQM